MGAPLGNSNATKGKPWAAAIARALAKRSRVDQKEALDELAEKLLCLCADGDLQALKELGDRLDGKPKQVTVLNGDEEGGPLVARIERVIVRANPADRDT